jgi:hypothetical protein
MSRPIDTSSDADQRMAEALRAMTPADRLHLADEMSAEVLALAEAGIRRRLPHLTATEVEIALAEIILGHDLAAAARRVRVARTR